MILRHILELLVNPFFISIFLLGIGIYLLWVRNYWRFGRLLVTLSLGIMLLISTGWLPKLLTYQLESQYPVITKTDPNVKWIVVLAGGRYEYRGFPPNDLLTSASISRLVEGIRLSKLLPQAKIVLSGGGNDPNESEAQELANLAMLLGISEQKIVLENQSKNTEEQAHRIAPIVKDNAFYLVTSAIHMPRAITLFQQLNLNPIAAPTEFTYSRNNKRLDRDIIPNTYNMKAFTIVMHELLGIAWAHCH